MRLNSKQSCHNRSSTSYLKYTLTNIVSEANTLVFTITKKLNQSSKGPSSEESTLKNQTPGFIRRWSQKTYLNCITESLE